MMQSVAKNLQKMLSVHSDQLLFQDFILPEAIYLAFLFRLVTKRGAVVDDVYKPYRRVKPAFG
jgi:hypothetical protein